jgi:Uma2 family endonuclease
MEKMLYQLADIEKLEALTEIRFELVDGLVYPKESSTPLSEEQIDILLAENIDYQWILTHIPMSSIKHKKLISELQSLIYRHLSPTYCCYGEGAEVLVSKKYLSFRKPDITISLRQNELYEKDYLLNPISLIEVLSPSTEKKDLNEKKEEYLAIPSLQEYVLVSQDLPKIQQFLRKNKTEWTMRVYDSKDQSCIPTVGVEIKLGALYEGIL